MLTEHNKPHKNCSYLTKKITTSLVPDAQDDVVVVVLSQKKAL